MHAYDAVDLADLADATHTQTLPRSPELRLGIRAQWPDATNALLGSCVVRGSTVLIGCFEVYQLLCCWIWVY